ncbi:MAG: hypothetical protein DRP42_00605 [Tenericutes bacterium]|nr:MAG: hypothetical protein DRP42_00605 [Mycoplasmatota bacterium]
MLKGDALAANRRLLDDAPELALDRPIEDVAGLEDRVRRKPAALRLHLVLAERGYLDELLGWVVVYVVEDRLEVWTLPAGAKAQRAATLLRSPSGDVDADTLGRVSGALDE